jgi:hypothetical protein
MKGLLSLGHEEMAMREGTREKRRKADQLANGTMVNWVMLLEEWRMKKSDKREVEYRKLAPEGPPHHVSRSCLLPCPDHGLLRAP